MMSGFGGSLQRADLTTRAIAGLIDLLLVIGLTSLPEAFGFLSAAGYILLRDGLLDCRSIGKKLVGLRVESTEGAGQAPGYRESIIRNVPLVIAYFLFLIPYAGWILGPLALGAEYLTALGDSGGMRIGDMLARTYVVTTVPVVGAPKNGSEQQADAARAGAIGPHDPQQ
jgi:uncharacterized RDD family membrane protein YckC